MVPGSFGCGSVVFAATTMLAPSFAARSAIARPIPRDAPVMNSVLFFRLISIDRERSIVDFLQHPPHDLARRCGGDRRDKLYCARHFVCGKMLATMRHKVCA